MKNKESWFRWHWQNLNEKELNRKGNPLRKGRAWFNFGKASLNIEWGCRLDGLSVSISTGDMEDMGPGFHIRLFFPYLYVRLTHPIFRKIFTKEKELGFYINSEYLQLNLFTSESDCEYNNKRSKFYNIRDILFGDFKYTKNDIKSFPVVIPLPEGSYNGVATISERIWKRSKIPFISQYKIDTWIELEKGLPFPGKGENSWDCGEDAIHGYGCSSIEYYDVVAKGVELCMRNRSKYGSNDWIPGHFSNGKLISVRADAINH